MKKTIQLHLVLGSVLLGILMLPVPGFGYVVTNSRFLPPSGSGYVGPGGPEAAYGGGIMIANVSHGGFDNSFAPPAPGMTDTHSFNSVVTGQVSFDAGTTWNPFMGSGLVTVRITFSGHSGNTDMYSTEMLGLNVSGGALPPGVMLRESPTLASTGETTIADLGDGDFRIDSFFDVFTELSLDDGMTWMPSTEPAVHMSVTPEPATLGLLMLGGLMLRRRA